MRGGEGGFRAARYRLRACREKGGSRTQEGAVMSETDEQRLEDQDAPEALEHDEESPDVEGHKLHMGGAEKVADPDKPFHKPYH